MNFAPAATRVELFLVNDLGAMPRHVLAIGVGVARQDPPGQRVRTGHGHLERPVGLLPREPVLGDAAEPRRRRDPRGGQPLAPQVVSVGALGSWRRLLLESGQEIVEPEDEVDPAHLAVGDDVDSGLCHIEDREPSRIVERLRNVGRAELAAVDGLQGRDEPRRRRVAADHRCGQYPADGPSPQRLCHEGRAGSKVEEEQPRLISARPRRRPVGCQPRRGGPHPPVWVAGCGPRRRTGGTRRNPSATPVTGPGKEEPRAVRRTKRQIGNSDRPDGVERMGQGFHRGDFDEDRPRAGFHDHRRSAAKRT